MGVFPLPRSCLVDTPPPGVISFGHKVLKSMNISTRFVIVAALLLGACTADVPEDTKFDTGTRLDLLPPTPDGPPGCPDPPQLMAPVLDPFPSQTTQQKQPLRGKAPGAAYIVATTGSGTSAPASVSSDGSFCIEVELIPDAANQVILTPRSANGCLGNTKRISITHKTGTKVDAGAGATPENLAPTAVFSSGETPKTGSLTSLVDNDAQSWAQFSMWDPEVSEKCDRFIWFRLDFGKAYTISKFKLRWGPLAQTNNSYGKCFTLLLSTKASPADPDPNNVNDWVIAKQIKDGDATAQEVTISPESARWAAVLLHEDGGGDILGYETFDVAEIEVWGQDPNIVPPPPVDRCE